MRSPMTLTVTKKGHGGRFLVITFLNILSGLSTKRCEKTWLIEKSRCYHVNSTAVSWQRASASCNHDNGYLVNLNDIAEQTLILNMRPFNFNSTHWIGFYKNESDWVWTDDPTSSFGLLKDANYTLGDDCAAITWKGEWLPTNCAELLPFFCEADLKGSANLTDHDSNLTGNERMANNPLSRGLFSNCSLMSHKTTRSECIQYIIHSSRILCQKSIPLDRIIPLDFPDKPSLIMDILAVIRAELQEDLTFQSCNHHINVLDFLEELLNAVIYAVDIGNYLSLTAEDTELAGIDLKPEQDTVFESTVAGCVINKVQTYEQGHNISGNVILVAAVLDKSVMKLVSLDNTAADEGVYLASPILTMAVFSNDVRISAVVEFTMFYSIEHVKDSKILSNGNSTNNRLICGFYNTSMRVWSVSGCEVVGEDEFTVTCRCDHTTSFAVLIKINNVKESLADEDALSIITYIGCSVSILTLFMAVTVFTCIRSIQSERIFVHRNLCIALLSSQVLFLAGINAVSYKVVCRVMAVVLHYSFTAVFTWMLVEGLHLYTQVIQVFQPCKSRENVYLAFGWGIPLLLVATSLAADFDGYGSDKSCWLSVSRHTIWAFVGPAGAVMIVNGIILLMVLNIVFTSSKNDSRSNLQQLRAGAKAALFLLPLMGVTWFLGLLVINKNLLVFEYLFAICNSLQGFLVFLFHCVLNTEVRTSLRRIRDRQILMKDKYSSTSESDRPAIDDEQQQSGTIHLKIECKAGIQVYSSVQNVDDVTTLKNREQNKMTGPTQAERNVDKDDGQVIHRDKMLSVTYI